MRVPCTVLALAIPAAASAGPAPVVGGSTAPIGKWPDAAAVYDGSSGTDQQVCSGTLIAPSVALTAGHCNEGTLVLDNILVGTNSLANPDAGEMLPVMQRIEYPSSQTSEDVTVLVLGRASRFAPRALATGWARLDIANGAKVELVGYGAVDKEANTYVNELQEAQSTITDFDCSTSSGCNAGAMPDGELGAGGMGIDTCPGDSGGPLYLVTSYGNFLAGVTSRSYNNATFPCGGGGIYERPDKIVDWIEQQTGMQVTHGPEPEANAIMVLAGDGSETVITPHDPKSEDHAYAVTTPPAHGTAKVRDDGRVRVCADPNASGSDAVTVTVTDNNDGKRAVEIAIPIAIVAGTPPPMACNVDAFSVAEAGCCDSGRGAAPTAIPLAIAILAVLRRRRS
jgi:endonuclease G